MSETNLMYVCSRCGSPSVEYSALVGGNASCKACSWSGSREDLSAIPVRKGGILDEEQTLRAMYNDFRKIFGANAQPFAQFLVKWGFVDATQSEGRIQIRDPKDVVRYINAIFFGAFTSVLKTREAQEKEKVRG